MANAPTQGSPDTELFLLEGADAAALAAAAARLAATPVSSSLAALSAEGLAACSGRAPWRAALVAGTPLELRQRLDQLGPLLQAAQGEGPPPTLHKDPTGHVFLSRRPLDPAPRVAFLFPGQGCQRLGMARVLIDRFPWARQMLALAERELAAVGAPAIGERMLVPLEGATEEDKARWFAALSDVEVAGPAIILAGALWARYLGILGVQPSAVGGHSQGEQVAFHVSGAVDFAGVIRLSAFMGRAGSPRFNPGTAGGMAVLACGAAEARRILATVAGYAIVANDNAPAQVVVAAEPDALAQLVRRATAQGIEARPLPVSHAFHSRLVAEGGEYLREHGPRLPPVPGELRARLFSCLEARPVAAGTRPLDYFADMVTRPVDFQATVRAMAAEVDLFLEPGAGRALSGLVAAIDPRLTCLPLEPVPGRTRALHVALAALHAVGAPVRWDLVQKGLVRPAPSAAPA